MPNPAPNYQKCSFSRITYVFSEQHYISFTLFYIPIFPLIPSYKMFRLLNIYISKLLLSVQERTILLSMLQFLVRNSFPGGGEEGGISCRGGGKCSVNIPSPCLLYLCCSILWCMQAVCFSLQVYTVNLKKKKNNLETFYVVPNCCTVGPKFQNFTF